MTLILAWVTKQFAVAACDGKAIHKHADGRIESASENENNASAALSKAFNQTL